MDDGYAAELEHQLFGCSTSCCGVSSDDEDDLDFILEREKMIEREFLQYDLERKLERRDRKKIEYLAFFNPIRTESQGRKIERVKLVKAGIDGYRLTWKHPRRSLRWDWREQMLDIRLIGEEEAATSEWEARQPQTVHFYEADTHGEEAWPTLEDFLRPAGEDEAFSDGFGDVPPHILNLNYVRNNTGASAFGIN